MLFIATKKGVKLSGHETAFSAQKCLIRQNGQRPFCQIFALAMP